MSASLYGRSLPHIVRPSRSSKCQANHNYHANCATYMHSNHKVYMSNHYKISTTRLFWHFLVVVCYIFCSHSGFIVKISKTLIEKIKRQ